MINHDIDHDDETIRRLFAAEATHPTSPDLVTLRQATHRSLRKRRLSGAAVCVAAMLAVGAPVYLGATPFSGQGGSGTPVAGAGSTSSSPADAPTSATLQQVPPGECGVLVCARPHVGSEEQNMVRGEPLLVASHDGVDELLYATRQEGYDHRTAAPATVDVLKLGYRDNSGLTNAVWALQPGTDSTSPTGDVTRFYYSRGVVGDKDSERTLVFGYVDGTPDQITWTSDTGASGTVDGMSSTVIDGYTVFYVSVAGEGQPEASEAARNDAGFRIQSSPNDAPGLTIHTSDGFSCSLQDCAHTG